MTNTTDIRTDLETFIGGPVWKMASVIPPLDASIATIEASGIFSELTDREAYLDFVANYKAVIKSAETEIRKLKAERCNPDDHARNSSQFKALGAAKAVTLAIQMRRLGKRWSADVRNREMAA
jgi:hypothetical protein